MRQQNWRETDRLEKNIDSRLEMLIFGLSYQSLCLKVRTEQLQQCVWLCSRAFYYKLFKHLGRFKEFMYVGAIS